MSSAWHISRHRADEPEKQNADPTPAIGLYPSNGIVYLIAASILVIDLEVHAIKDSLTDALAAS